MNYLIVANISGVLLCVVDKTTNIFMENIWWNIIIGLSVGVVSSIIGKYVVEGIKSLWFYRQYESMGLEKVFANQEKAKESIIKESKKSKKLYVLAVKADSFSNPKEMFYSIAKNTNISKQCFLVSNPTNPYIKTRAIELDSPDLAKSVEFSIENLKGIQKSKNTHLMYRLHEEVVRFRIILFDDYLYLSFQKVNVKGQESRILKIKKDSDMYETYSTYFNDLWEKYAPQQT